MNKINVRDVIYSALRDKGCRVETDPASGIVLVTDPTGKTWDFTIPQPSVVEEEIHAKKLSRAHDMLAEEWHDDETSPAKKFIT